MKYCKKCGNELVDEAVICPKCGCAAEKPEPTKEENHKTRNMIISIILIVIGVSMFVGMFAGLISLY